MCCPLIWVIGLAVLLGGGAIIGGGGAGGGLADLWHSLLSLDLGGILG